VIDEFRALGVSEDDLAALQDTQAEATEEGVCEIWGENIFALRLFLAAMTQWRRDTTSGLPTGLDYSGVEAGFRMMGRRIKRRHFDDLQVMEMAYVAESARLFRKAQDSNT
jgi:hypothetical protein